MPRNGLSKTDMFVLQLCFQILTVSNIFCIVLGKFSMERIKNESITENNLASSGQKNDLYRTTEFGRIRICNF